MNSKAFNASLIHYIKGAVGQQILNYYRLLISLVFEHSLNKITCSGFLEEAYNVFCYDKWLFQQDNARLHISSDILLAIKSL